MAWTAPTLSKLESLLPSCYTLAKKTKESSWDDCNILCIILLNNVHMSCLKSWWKNGCFSHSPLTKARSLSGIVILSSIDHCQYTQYAGERLAPYHKQWHCSYDPCKFHKTKTDLTFLAASMPITPIGIKTDKGEHHGCSLRNRCAYRWRRPMLQWRKDQRSHSVVVPQQDCRQEWESVPL